MTLVYHDAKIIPLKHGLYRLDVGDNRLRVFDGEAQVTQNDQTTQVRAGHQIEFGTVFLASKFDRKYGDSLDSWAANRSQRIAQANLTSANMVSSGGGYSSYNSSNWVWNPYFGLFTFVPYSGFGYNPYGWTIYSPRTVGYYYAYQQPNYANSGNAGNARITNGLSNSNNSGSAQGTAMSSSIGSAAPMSAGTASVGRGPSGGGARGGR